MLPERIGEKEMPVDRDRRKGFRKWKRGRAVRQIIDLPRMQNFVLNLIYRKDLRLVDIQEKTRYLSDKDEVLSEGISISTISRISNGGPCDCQTLFLLCNGFNESANYLLGLDNIPTNKDIDENLLAAIQAGAEDLELEQHGMIEEELRPPATVGSVEAAEEEESDEPFELEDDDELENEREETLEDLKNDAKDS